MPSVLTQKNKVSPFIKKNFYENLILTIGSPLNVLLKNIRI